MLQNTGEDASCAEGLSTLVSHLDIASLRLVSVFDGLPV